ncbi:MAG: HD domain-containing protein [Chitinophagales bacterium]|nr:HD domain-containing protein [Chitinophagales bacterium]
MKYSDKIYGEFELSGVIEELIETKVFQRLKKIHQGGAIILVNPIMNHTRFDHSIGVMCLIRKLGGDITEQIAGLIHDISHTAFSHLIDYVLENEQEDYHEERFGEILQDEELTNVLTKNGFDPAVFLDIEQFKLLEYPLPNLSADRIDYTLRDMFLLGQISQEEIDWFLSGLQVHEDRVVLKSDDYGKWFQTQYEYLVKEYFGGMENREVNTIMKDIIQSCLANGTIEIRDFHQDDFYLLEKINRSMNLMDKIAEMRSQGVNTKNLITKKRVVNPEILVNNQVIRFSEISQ